MSKLPRLKVKWWSLEAKEEIIIEFEQAKDEIFGNSDKWAVATAEGQAINSYEDLLQVAMQDKNKDKEVLNVMLLVPLIGGG